MSGRSPVNPAALHAAASNIAGSSEGMKRQLKQLDAELKEAQRGKREFEEYLSKLQIERTDIEQRMQRNQEYIANFERSQDNGAFEAQYKRLLEDIQAIYESAKEFHGKGIDMLIKDFGYHIAYKRWNDSFSAVPFKPK